MYYPTTRVLTILELLQARPGLSGAELAARLEVDRRTVRRYITMLQDLGIPIEAIRGPLGGYRRRRGACDYAQPDRRAAPRQRCRRAGDRGRAGKDRARAAGWAACASSGGTV